MYLPLAIQQIDDTLHLVTISPSVPQLGSMHLKTITPGLLSLVSHAHLDVSPPSPLGSLPCTMASLYYFPSILLL